MRFTIQVKEGQTFDLTINLNAYAISVVTVCRKMLWVYCKENTSCINQAVSCSSMKQKGCIKQAIYIFGLH